MSINQNNITNTVNGILKGQRVIRVGSHYYPVGIGGNFIPGSSSDQSQIQLPNVTVTSDKLLSGITAISKNENGQPITITGQIQTIQLSDISIEENIIFIPSGYIETEGLSKELPMAQINVSGRTVSVDQSGYIYAGQFFNVELAEIVQTQDTLTISPGYVEQQLIYQLKKTNANSNVLYGYIDDDGKFQQIQLSGDVPIDVGNYVDCDLKIFKTGQNQPLYNQINDIDLSDVTVTVDNMLQGVVAINSNGEKITGNIKTVIPQISGNTITVEKGYVATRYTKTLEQSGNTIIQGNKVTVPSGYLSTNRIATISEATITKTDEYVNITPGYIGEQLNYELFTDSDIDLSNITITEDQILSGYYGINSEGQLIQGAIPIRVNDYLSIEGNSVTGPRGYYQEDLYIQLPQSTGQIIQNRVNITYGYCDEDREFEIPLAQINRNENSITISEGYVQEQITFVGSSSGDSGDSGNSNVQYGYITQDGKVQKIDVDSEEPTAIGQPIEMTIHLFDTGVEEPVYQPGNDGNIGGSGNCDGMFNLVKVTEYIPYKPATEYITSVNVSGIEDLIWSDDPESQDYEYNQYYSEANGVYNVTSETSEETDWRKRIYKHESKQYYLFYEYYDDYPEESTWFFSTTADSDGQFIRKYNEYDWDTDETLPVGNLESGESEWGDYDWEPFYVTLDVRTTAIPETSMVLKGVLAAGYADGKWSFDNVVYNFEGFEYQPLVGNLYVFKDNKLIGFSIGTPGGITYLRFRIDKIRENNDGVQISEFLLFDKSDTPVYFTSIGVAEVSADNNNDSPNEQKPEKAFNGVLSNNDKWFSYEFGNPSWIQVKFNQPIILENYPKYGWYTANDSDERDPVSWEILGSVDGKTWNTLSKVTDYSTTTNRNSLVGIWQFNSY